MDRDVRYTIIKPLLADGRIQTFTDIFKYVPRTIIAKDLGFNPSRFTEMMTKVEKFRLEDLFHLARLVNIEEKEMLELIYKEYELNKTKVEK